jgi:hypothetical protein
MTRVLPLRPPDSPEMHARAMDNLRYIRETMEAAATFTAVSGWGMVMIGATALGAAFLSAEVESPTRWVFIWLCEACLSMAISVYTMALKARAAQLPLWSEPARKMVFSFAPPMMVVPVMGLAFMIVGTVALFAPPSWSAITMATGFGALHLFFGTLIARRHGG